MINKAKLDLYTSMYKQHLQRQNHPHLELWHECLIQFSEQWDLDHLDLSTMYDYSLKSKINTSLWKGDDYHPKEVMLLFIDYDKEIVRSLFRDLIEERRELSGRMERFVFYCDQLLKEIQPKCKYPDHYHGDYFMVSLYLTFIDPSAYTFYRYEVFKKSMEHLGARNIPLTNELDRYFKIVKIIDKLVSSDEELIKIYNYKTKKYPTSKNLLMVYDFLNYVYNHPLPSV